jgi:hypothetical protein
MCSSASIWSFRIFNFKFHSPITEGVTCTYIKMKIMLNYYWAARLGHRRAVARNKRRGEAGGSVGREIRGGSGSEVGKAGAEISLPQKQSCV